MVMTCFFIRSKLVGLLMMIVSLFRFWKQAGYVPLYVQQTMSELTGEHTCVVVRGLNTSVESELEWLHKFVRGTFVRLLFFPSA